MLVLKLLLGRGTIDEVKINVQSSAMEIYFR